ncbi:MAG: LysR family transcriptional regulator [Bacteroidetes bacterium]|nr:LysR family transcriptional regulator [Bacteroidota bacterium]
MTEENEFPKYSNIRVCYRIWLESEDNMKILSDDTWALLRSIGELGTLTRASEAMNISYRKAWGDLKKAEQLLGFALIEKHRGGARGGETRLSGEGLSFVKAFEDFHTEFENDVQQAIRRFKRKLKGKPV